MAELLIPVAAIFGVIMLPILAVVFVIAYRMQAARKRFEGMMAERRHLIEKGVTDLPPLPQEMPRTAGDQYGNLKAGVILLVLAVATLVSKFVTPSLDDEAFACAIYLGLLGLGLIGIHYLIGHLRRKEVQPDTCEVHVGREA